MEYPKHLRKYIPPDFKIEKYEAAKNLDLYGWFVNLSMRIIYQSSPSDCIELGVILVKPPFNASNYTGVDLSYLESEFGVVKRLVLDDLMNVIEDLEKDGRNRDFIELYQHVSENGDSISAKKKLRTFDIPKIDSEEWLSIDLSFSDNEIKNAFENWLKRKRQDILGSNTVRRSGREPVIRDFSKAAIRRWHSNRVLPYLDLKNWNSVQGNNVTSEILGQILFPNNKNGSTSMIDDTVKPLAKKLLSSQIRNRMWGAFGELEKEYFNEMFK
jgi:hypothetical protein